MFVIFGTAVDNRAAKVGGLFIGLTRDLGYPGGRTAHRRGHEPGSLVRSGGGSARLLTRAWVYIVGPLGGALAGALVYSAIMEDKQLLPPDAPVRTVKEGSSG